MAGNSALRCGADGPSLIDLQIYILTLDETIDYETHSFFMKYCALVILSGIVLLLLGNGWLPLLACVLSVLVLAAFVGRLRR